MEESKRVGGKKCRAGGKNMFYDRKEEDEGGKKADDQGGMDGERGRERSGAEKDGKKNGGK